MYEYKCTLLCCTHRTPVQTSVYKTRTILYFRICHCTSTQATSDMRINWGLQLYWTKVNQNGSEKNSQKQLWWFEYPYENFGKLWIGWITNAAKLRAQQVSDTVWLKFNGTPRRSSIRERLAGWRGVCRVASARRLVANDRRTACLQNRSVQTSRMLIAVAELKRTRTVLYLSTVLFAFASALSYIHVL